MPRKASSRERLTRLQAEAAATEREREERKKTGAAPKKKAPATRKPRTPKAAARMKVVWSVCERSGAVVKQFAYPDRSKADAEAASLTQSKSAEHFVRADKVPMEES